MMLLSFILLMSWRVSGVTAHEWIGLSLIVLIVVHLLIHWGWVEGSIARVRRHTHRGGAIPLLLNTALFVGMGTALVSGVVISKVVFPNQLLPGDYLHWHSLHENASTLTLFILGLHVALNWDRIRNSFSRFLGRTNYQARGGWGISSKVLVRRLAWILGLSAVLVVGVLVGWRAIPSHDEVLMTFPDGHTALVTAPPEIARLQRGSTIPNVPRGAPKVVLSLVFLSIAAVVGRRVLRLRLAPRQTIRRERAA